MRKLIVFALILFSVTAWAEDEPAWVGAGLVHNTLGVPAPSNASAVPLLPGFQLSLEKQLWPGEYVDWRGALTGRVVFHPDSPHGTVISVGGELAPGSVVGPGFFVDSVVGVAYSLAFSHATTVALADADVDLERDRPRPELTLNLGVRTGYDFSVRGHLGLRVFARYDAELSFAPAQGFGMINPLPAASLTIGTQIALPHGAE